MSFKTRRISQQARKPFPWAKVLAGAAAMIAPARAWVRRYRERKEEERKHRWWMEVLKRVGVVLAGLIAAVIVLLVLLRILFALQIIHLSTFLSTTAADLSKDRYGATNFLLLGAGDINHDGVDLTDSMMVVSLDPDTTQSALMLSIPRDLYVLKTAKMGKGRVNSLYRDYKYYLKAREKMEESEASQTSMRELAAELSQALGIEIHHVVKADFTGFVKAVDAIGGIDVVVPYDIDDREYPGPNYSYETFSIGAGTRHFDGETALKYVRSRHTTSDFGRSARQQQVLSVIAERAQEEGWAGDTGKILSFLKILTSHVETTMTFREILGAASIAEQIDRTKIITLQLNDRSAYGGGIPEPGGLLYPPPRDQFDGASVFLPASIPESPVTWKQVQVFTHLLMSRRDIALARPPVRILNAGAASGLGRKLASELGRFGFTIETVENAAFPKQPRSFVVDAGGTPAHREFFAELLKMDLAPAPAEESSSSLAPLPVTIVLGKDYTYAALQSLVTLPSAVAP